MSERELEHEVRSIINDICGKTGRKLLAYHTRNSTGSHAGFPDWTFASPFGQMFRELKTEKKQPTPKQAEWLQVLQQGGADADVWRPSDWASGRITTELTDLAGLRSAREANQMTSPGRRHGRRP